RVQSLDDPVEIAHHIAPQFAPDATLDHAPLPADAIDDPDLLADLIEDSTLADLSASEITGIETLELSDTTASIRIHCSADPAHPFQADLSLTRNSATSPWLITSMSSAARPAPVPQSASP
ncbi:MAG: hypothetical protein AABZ53_04770, partial [Planctomycetota bacterium]